MDILQTFVFDNVKHDVTVVQKDGKNLFRADEVGKIVGIKNMRDAIKKFDEDEKAVDKVDTPGGVQNAIFLTELGIHRALM